MKKLYRMAVKNLRTGERDTYVSEKQGAAPAGWKCTGVCGSFELPEGENFDYAWQAQKYVGKRR